MRLALQIATGIIIGGIVLYGLYELKTRIELQQLADELQRSNIAEATRRQREREAIEAGRRRAAEILQREAAKRCEIRTADGRTLNC